MTFQGAQCAVRSWLTNKDPSERALGRLVHSGEWYHGLSHHSQPAQRQKLSLVRDNFFSHGLFPEKAEKNGLKSSSTLLSYIPSEFRCLSPGKMELICRYISFSFKFLYLSSSFDTTKNSIPKNLYACLSLKLHADLPPALLPLQMKTMILKAGILTDTIKQTPQWQPKLDLTEMQTVLSAVYWNIMQWLSLLCVYTSCDFQSFVSYGAVWCYKIIVVVVVVYLAFPRKERKRKDENSRNCTDCFTSNLFHP